MCQRLNARNHVLPRSCPYSSEALSSTAAHPIFPSRKVPTITSIYDDWLASRIVPRHRGALLAPGAQRAYTRTNSKLAVRITQECAIDLCKLLWSLHPVRITVMMSLNVVRGVFPAFRGYSQALILDELQSLVASNHFTWSRLLRLMATELLRRILEGLLDSFATSNENHVYSSLRFFVEHEQLSTCVRLDIPTLADPIVRDLLQESELFVRSFSGMGFGLLSPFDFVRVLALISELFSHIWVLLSLTGGMAHIGILALSLLSSLLPFACRWCGVGETRGETPYSRQEARTAQRQEQLRNLAHSESHRPEIILFGLGPWILKSWSKARRSMLRAELTTPSETRGLSFSFLSQINASDLVFALQNIPLVLLLQSSSASLGSLALYRSSVQAVALTIRQLLSTVQMAFQSIFLMSAFCAAMRIQPRLRPKEVAVKYQSATRGMGIRIQNLWYTYPGNVEPSLRNVDLELEAGERLAIVGYNGSGKSTLAKMLLRILDYDEGSILVNGVDIRRHDPADYHSHITTVFQGFSKFNSTVKENVGVGCISKIGSRPAVEEAVQLAGASAIVDTLPRGLNTKLDDGGFDSVGYGPYSGSSNMTAPSYMPHGLSGGEWQRIAISRAFMRASEPDVDLLLFDEPTSSLDAHAQKHIFDIIDELSRSPTGEKQKTVVFITHRLSTARRADKIAMMEDGTITEFGTHEELLQRHGAYAALYHASI